MLELIDSLCSAFWVCLDRNRISVWTVELDHVNMSGKTLFSRNLGWRKSDFSVYISSDGMWKYCVHKNKCFLWVWKNLTAVVPLLSWDPSLMFCFQWVTRRERSELRFETFFVSLLFGGVGREGRNECFTVEDGVGMVAWSFVLVCWFLYFMIHCYEKNYFKVCVILAPKWKEWVCCMQSCAGE